ncbi:MAG: DNA modification methylase [Parcubacteria group bacterium Licking1014_1]|nr:MAG: DNA modification methylase [Parcubacteria group bacterium Licking1014_1]
MITQKQKQVLDYIISYCKKRGYSPALEEIRKHFKLASVSTAHFHVKKLEKLGLLEKQFNKPRSIDIYENDKMVNIPLLGLIAAGQPIEAIQNKETIAVPQNKLPRSGEFYALRVLGNSMIDENINDGDIVLVKQQCIAENGQKVVALIDNSEATLKKFYKEKGHIRLQPANKTIEPIIVKKDKDLTIQGIVIDVIKNEEDLQALELLPAKEIKQFDTLPLNEIICGDAVEVMKAMPPNSIDLVVTSPPYDELRNYNGYTFNFDGIARGLFRVIKKGGIVVWVVGDKINKGNKTLTSFKQALSFQDIGFNVHDVMIYKKKNTPFMRSNAYTNCYEFMFVLSKGSPNTFNPLKTRTVRQGQEMLPFNKKADGVNKKILGELKPEKTLTNIWDYAVGYGGSTSDKIAFQHTAIFPEKLAEDHILSWTKAGDVVFDPMCGSGTTCKMAAINKRHYIGCDISKEYTELTKKRLKHFNF